MSRKPSSSIRLSYGEHALQAEAQQLAIGVGAAGDVAEHLGEGLVGDLDLLLRPGAAADGYGLDDGRRARPRYLDEERGALARAGEVRTPRVGGVGAPPDVEAGAEAHGLGSAGVGRAHRAVRAALQLLAMPMPQGQVVEPPAGGRVEGDGVVIGRQEGAVHEAAVGKAEADRGRLSGLDPVRGVERRTLRRNGAGEEHDAVPRRHGLRPRQHAQRRPLRVRPGRALPEGAGAVRVVIARQHVDRRGAALEHVEGALRIRPRRPRCHRTDRPR